MAAIWTCHLREAAERLGLTLVSRRNNTYMGPCPCCGGHDRFRIFEGNKYPIVEMCNHCDNVSRMECLIELGLVKSIKGGA